MTDIPPRWYCVTKHGYSTLCVDEEDARNLAVASDAMSPRNAPHTAVQLAPVPAQGAAIKSSLSNSSSNSIHAQGAEGVEALAARLEAHADAHANVSPHDDEQAEWERDLRDAARRLRNSPESPDGSFSLLSLIADIRAAAGDPTGKLMQDELVAHVIALRVDAERYRWLRKPYNAIVYALDPINWNKAPHSNKTHYRYETPEILDAAIDAARSAGGDDA